MAVTEVRKRGRPKRNTLRAALTRARVGAVRSAIDAAGGDVNGIARTLGCSRSHVYMLIGAHPALRRAQDAATRRALRARRAAARQAFSSNGRR